MTILRIHSTDRDLLSQKLQTASFPDELDSAGRDLGVPLDEIKRLSTYWRHGFDWRAKQKELNEKAPPVHGLCVHSRLRGAGYTLSAPYEPHACSVALLAWIYDKRHEWSDGYPWTDDEILTWVSIYQFSAAGPAASVHIYYEAAQAPPAGFSASISDRISTADAIAMSIPGSVKLAVAHFKRELIKLPLLWCRAMGSIVLLAADVGGFMGKEDEAYAVVTGKDGY
ncbi:epoxide hydrolase [Aspergillus clavatus NRRL 1]|uniref:Epoxide hydrolase, putative n=1 Tax=Aspergillus clavatus (strain ATCC 1007 / CBS 513.65 / DSM 816 / NCTC 3887 / NRRL 1 / QM 1276 / 107) TaxID=344612 RepID=A1CH52_ASPCL|nr:epoxide hydrolase, putative [Aspergillus clavatus NRRL 1]EAW10207.1 epoxide hydrolase, putative [Aspergillus clavatus NRRL 1]